MMSEDTTIWNGNQPKPELKKKSEKKDDNSTWKTVTIGGAAAVLLGAGAAYAASTAGGDEIEVVPTNDEGHVAVESAHSGGESFAEAFEAARAEQGPGGVFSWHGNLYNTYTQDEWANLSDAEKDAFVSNALSKHPVEAQPVVAEPSPINVEPVIEPEPVVAGIGEGHTVVEPVSGTEVGGATNIYNVNVYGDINADEGASVSIGGDFNANQETNVDNSVTTIDDSQHVTSIEQHIDQSNHVALVDQDIDNSVSTFDYNNQEYHSDDNFQQLHQEVHDTMVYDTGTDIDHVDVCGTDNLVDL